MVLMRLYEPSELEQEAAATAARDEKAGIDNQK